MYHIIIFFLVFVYNFVLPHLRVKFLGMRQLARKREDQVHAGLERLKWEANHTYKEMALALGKSTAALYKVSRGERSLNDEWVRNICQVYSRLLKRNVTEAEVRGQSTRGFVEFHNLGEFPPDEGGALVEAQYEYITQMNTDDLSGFIPSGSYAYLMPQPNMQDNGIYIIEINDEIRVARYRSDEQPRFETQPRDVSNVQSWFVNNLEYRILYRITAFYTVL